MTKENITILGAGESGTGAALLAKAKGFNVFVSDYGTIKDKYKAELDAEGISYEEAKHSEELILNADLIVKSPGIPDKAPIIKKAVEKGILLIDEIEFASRYTDARFIGITGTNGKTTTTLLTYHLLKEAGLKVGLAGNVGVSLARQVIEDNNDFYVLELSSFQLDGTVNFKPEVGVLLNITPDHMDRYEYSMEKYTDSKFQLIKNMELQDHFVYFADSQIIASWLKKNVCKAKQHPISLVGASELCLKDGILHFEDGHTISQAELPLRGEHNAVNIMAAVSVAKAVGIDGENIEKALMTFKNAPHRMEYVATIDGVDFINDSKATNVDAVKYAIDSFDKPLVWIAGGIDKGNDYGFIMEAINAKVKALVCLGKDNSKLRDAFHDQIIDMLETDDVNHAVKAAYEYADVNDVVLLSPACASFDLFKNYEDRGDKFKKAVLDLKEELAKEA